MNESTPAKTKEHNLAFLFTAYLLTNNKLSWRSLFGVFSLLSSVFFCSNTSAQIVPDNTLGTENSTVQQDNLNGLAIDLIEGGATRGTNLFHSFAEFNIAVEKGAYFANPEGINNIFSRVTGSNPSQILGTLGVLGNSNLFLLNPNGIFFGENARLNVGGSFFASTADSLLFDNGFEFSGSNPEAPPLLTVNIPIGLGFRENPGEVVNRSFVRNDAGDFVGLEVAPGKNLTLVGGNINFEAGEATVRGGNIQLGGLSTAGTVGISDDGSLNFPEAVARADISLSNGADVDVRGTGGGSITINAGNLTLEAGEFGSSFLRGGITADSTSADAQAGDIIVDVAENITLNDSRIINQVNSGAVGNSGNITISTTSLDATNGGDIDASIFGRGDAGSLKITATDTITFDGKDSDGFASGATSQVDEEAVGDAGGVTIDTGSLFLTNGGRVGANTFGQGNAGNITLDVEGAVDISAGNIFSNIGSEAVGNIGKIFIEAKSVSLTDGAQLQAGVFSGGQGEAAGIISIKAEDSISFAGTNSEGNRSGIFSDVESQAIGDGSDIELSANSVSLIDNAILKASNAGQGNAGSVIVKATDKISLANNSEITSNVGNSDGVSAVGKVGNIFLKANEITLTDGAQIEAGFFSNARGEAGIISVKAEDSISFEGINTAIFSNSEAGAVGNGSDIELSATSISLSDGAFLNANNGGQGNAGDITITTGSLSLTNGTQLRNSTFGEGDAGSVDIQANGTVKLSGSNSSIFSNVERGGQGNGGEINIQAQSLSLSDGAQIQSGLRGSSEELPGGRGNGGKVNIDVRDTVTLIGVSESGLSSAIFTDVESGAIGNGGDINIKARSLSLEDGAQINTSTFGQGDAGSISIDISEKVLFANDSGALSQVGITQGEQGEIIPGEGNAGNIEVTTANLSLTGGSQLTAGVFGNGDAGKVIINATESVLFQGTNESTGLSSGVVNNVAFGGVGNAGDIEITTDSLTLRDGGGISSITQGTGNAGKIDLIGRSLSLEDGAQISTSTFGQGNAALVTINASNTITIDGEDSEGFVSTVSSAVALEAEGDAGGVIIDTSSLSLTNGGRVIAGTFGQGNAGSVEITASDNITIDGENSEGFNSDVSSDVNSEAEGDAGGVTITTANLTLTNGGTVGATTFGRGNAGQVIINASNTIIIDGEDPSDDETVGGIFSTVSDGAIGNAGGVEITTGNLTLTNAGTINASTFSQGNAGQVNINASDTISIDGDDLEGFNSGAFSQVNSEAEGDAGGVNIDTGSLSLTNGGTVSADTFGRGNAGTVNISATDKITIDGEDSDGFVSEASSSVNSAAEGDAGGVTIETGSLSLTNGGRVIASTVGEGNAGDVTVNARESITISGTTETESFRSGISADAFVSSGNGGDVNVFTNRLIINDGGSIQAGNFDNVDSLDKFNPGTGQPGNINIEANSLSLNRGRIEATTQSEVGEAANINLTIAEDIFFKNNSSISARASGNANGGNVTINAKDGSIVAFPNQNNDIIANAQQGNGGNIKITTQAIFGLEERRSTPVNQTNDIDASSQFGLQGDFSLNTPENEPSRGLVDLPENVVNPEDLISQNACKKGGTSKFTVTGRGGLPATPEQIHHSDEVEVGLVKPAMGMAAVIKDLPVAEDSTKLVPAKGWIRNEQGEVFLVGYDPTVSNILPQPENLDFCQPRGND